MKYVDEYRSIKLVNKLTRQIHDLGVSGQINIMEVCGTHTQSFFRFGVDKLLPDNIRLISGPGCPVCVSPQEYIDSAIALAAREKVIIATFGDMLRIPGSSSTLEKQRAKGGEIKVVYSPLDSLRIARENPMHRVVFLAVGFETTIPTVGLTILKAGKERINNLSFFCALKLIPPALDYLLRDKRLNLSGLLCPGHVTSIIGTAAYEFVTKKYNIPCCVAGFEPVDILEGIYIILKQIRSANPRVSNEYTRIVKKQGNPKAKRVISRVFKDADSCWRGLGNIPHSGLVIRKEFSQFDARNVFGIMPTAHRRRATAKCRCGDVLKGLIRPSACPSFARACTPDNPAGPCMVSQEGACSIYYKYR